VIDAGRNGCEYFDNNNNNIHGFLANPAPCLALSPVLACGA
jgi:hypothetical protein